MELQKKCEIDREEDFLWKIQAQTGLRLVDKPGFIGYNTVNQMLSMEEGY